MKQQFGKFKTSNKVIPEHFSAFLKSILTISKVLPWDLWMVKLQESIGRNYLQINVLPLSTHFTWIAGIVTVLVNAAPSKKGVECVHPLLEIDVISASGKTFPLGPETFLLTYFRPQIGCQHNTCSITQNGWTNNQTKELPVYLSESLLGHFEPVTRSSFIKANNNNNIHAWSLLA